MSYKLLDTNILIQNKNKLRQYNWVIHKDRVRLVQCDNHWVGLSWVKLSWVPQIGLGWVELSWVEFPEFNSGGRQDFFSEG